MRQRRDMFPSIVALMREQHGLITRSQAASAGLDGDAVDTLLRAGQWVSVRRGVYATAPTRASATSTRARRLLVDRATSLAMRTPHVMSHDSSAHELGLDTLVPPDVMTHVTRPGLQGSRNRFGVKHHLAGYHESQVVVFGGRRVLDPARTSVDIAREHGYPYGVVAVDSAYRLGVGRPELARALRPMGCWPGVTRSRSAVDLSDEGADSVGETLGRQLVCELGLGTPVTQFGLTADGRVAWVDLRPGRHLFEFEGRVKYQRVEDGGLAVRSADDVVWAEKQRQDWLCGFQLGMSRIVWADFWGAARERAVARLRRDVLATQSLFGNDISNLATYAVLVPRRRSRPFAA